MKKKALTLAIAAALSAPASFAATDTSGMRYTSASEGFYASIRAIYETKSEKGGKGNVGNDGSRIGIRGTNDMGGGLEGFYQWEAEVPINDAASGDADSINTRLGHVGVRGAFGQIQLGSFWTSEYSAVGVLTDFAGTTADFSWYTRQREGRSQNAIEYTTPDLNGFTGAARVSTDRESGSGSTIGLWNLSGKYEIHGFTVGASYNVLKDKYASVAAVAEASGQPNIPAFGGGDMKSWNVGLGYSQDNWYVGGYYGVDDTSSDKGGFAQRRYDKNGMADDGPGGDNPNEEAIAKSGCGSAASTRVLTQTAVIGKNCEDRKIFSVGAGVTLDKVELNAAWEKIEQADGIEEVNGGVEATYRFTSSSRVALRYAIRDWKSNPNRENTVRALLRHDF